MTTVAVVVPIYKSSLSADERISLHHLDHYLGGYERVLLAPQHLDLNFSTFRIVRFEDEYFQNTFTYSKLLLSRRFYTAFSLYDYILICQLDCLVFSSGIDVWLESGYDYIGAPWFKDPQRAESGFARVGNGGLSLRRVESFLRVLTSSRYVSRPVPFWADLFKPVYDEDDPLPPLKLAWHHLKRRFRVLLQVRRGIGWYTANYSLNEDRFWSDRAMFFDPHFKIAPVKAGLRFAFERFPRYCYERNERQLPFGAHAWAKWDRSFWEPHLI